jgi:nitrogen fixation protein FixH
MVLICLVAFFGVVAGVNAIMIRAAVSTFGGVETESSYKAGLAFAREVAAARAQDERHWQVKAAILPGPEQKRIEVVATDAGGRPLRGLSATVRLAHPTDRRSDRTVALPEASPGQFSGEAGVAAGQWDLVVELSRDGERVFRSKSRVTVH